MMQSEAVCIAYETVEDAHGKLTLLEPMSEVAGRMAIQAGMHYLTKPNGGRGVLLGGVAGVPRGKVLIIGGGVVGLNAAKAAAGVGANVVIMDKCLNRLRYIVSVWGTIINKCWSHTGSDLFVLLLGGNLNTNSGFLNDLLLAALNSLKCADFLPALRSG